MVMKLIKQGRRMKACFALLVIVVLAMSVGFFMGTSRAHASASFVKATTGYFIGNSLTLPVSATTGNLLFVAINYVNTGATITIADGSNTYTLLSASQSPYSSTHDFYAKNIVGGSLSLTFNS